MNRLALSLAAVLALAGCVTATQSTAITTTLTQLGNTLTADLQQQRAVALAATPPDNDGASCAGTLPDPTKSGDLGTGALAVAAAIQRVAAVTANQQVGTLTGAEIATLYQPGSDQDNWAVKTIETACVAKFHDVNQAAVATTTAVVGSLGTILALGPAK